MPDEQKDPLHDGSLYYQFAPHLFNHKFTCAQDTTETQFEELRQLALNIYKPDEYPRPEAIPPMPEPPRSLCSGMARLMLFGSGMKPCLDCRDADGKPTVHKVHGFIFN